MKFDRLEDDRRKVTFEVDEETNFHEQAVAMSALGIFTSKHRKDPEKRLPPAKLGAIIAVQEMKQEKEGGQSAIAPTFGKLDGATAVLLGAALEEFIKDTPDAIRAQVAVGNPHACSVRAVEDEMAQNMLEQLGEEFGFDVLPPAKSSPSPTGFK